jgi:hypothetical protein
MVQAITRLIGKRHPHNFGKRCAVRLQSGLRKPQRRDAKPTDPAQGLKVRGGRKIPFSIQRSGIARIFAQAVDAA